MSSFPWKYMLSDHSCSIYAEKRVQNYTKQSGTPLQIEAVTEQILRIHARTEPSFAVEEELLPTGKLAAEETTNLTLSTDRLLITVDGDLHLQIYDRTGQLLCADYTGTLQEAEALSQAEMEQMIQEGHIVHTGEDSCRFQIAKQLFGDEAFYGLGDKTGFLNKRGYDFTMWNSDNPDPQVENPTFKAMYKSIPFFITLRPNCVYGIFFDNHHKSYFDMGYSSTLYYSFGAAEGELDYYFIHGDTIAEVISGYTAITGRSPLPQLWTLGYHQSRWSYSSADEVLELAKSFRRHNIPCDAIHLDIDYMDQFKVFTVDRQRFPELLQLSRELNSMGIKLVTIIDPGTKLEDGYSLYEEGVENGYFALDSDGQIYQNVVWPGASVFPDFTSSRVRNWWGNQIPVLLQQGIRGIWNDMNEPASFQGPLPDDVVFPGDDTPRFHREVHNVYGHFMAKATYEGLKKQDNRRPFVITRACYSGSQKYSTAWTGDNQSIWSHLKMSIPQLLNLGMSGMPLVGTDIGGFGSNTTPELLSRWIEAGCFAPLFRNHCAKYSRRQEPWQFDTETLDINRKYIRLRYKFLPYLYDLCYQETQSGLPILRPLVLHYEKDPNTWECNDEYLVGDSLLVAPITDQGARARAVYLPEGNWVDYWTGEHIQGQKYILRDAPLDLCPIYVKAGSILPTWQEMDYIPEQGSDELILEYYPAATASTYTHYQDNGADFSYEKGEYNLYQFHITAGQTLETTMKHQGYTPCYQKISLVIR